MLIDMHTLKPTNISLYFCLDIMLAAPIRARLPSILLKYVGYIPYSRPILHVLYSTYRKKEINRTKKHLFFSVLKWEARLVLNLSY